MGHIAHWFNGIFALHQENKACVLVYTPCALATLEGIYG